MSIKRDSTTAFWDGGVPEYTNGLSGPNYTNQQYLRRGTPHTLHTQIYTNFVATIIPIKEDNGKVADHRLYQHLGFQFTPLESDHPPRGGNATKKQKEQPFGAYTPVKDPFITSTSVKSVYNLASANYLLAVLTKKRDISAKEIFKRISPF